MDRDKGALRDFETFLSKLGTIPDDKTKFYFHWVRRFLKSCNYQLDNITTERVSHWFTPMWYQRNLLRSKVHWMVYEKSKGGVIIFLFKGGLKGIFMVRRWWPITNNCQERFGIVVLQYIYIGNVPGHIFNSTYCPSYNRRIIHRTHFDILEMNIANGRCRFCNS